MNPISAMNMKKLFFILPFIFCFFSCDDNDFQKDEMEEPVTPKERVDIVLTKVEIDIVNSTNQFAFDLYRKIHLEEEMKSNLFISPLGVSLAFSMLNNGAAGDSAGDSREEIQRVLGFDGYKAEEINSFYQKMLEAAMEIDPQVTLESANSIWIQDNFPVKENFVAVNKEYFDAEIKNVDFAKAATLKTINDWASEKTHGKITDFLKELSPDTRIFLMNALYFLGEWTEPFEKSNTRQDTFTNMNGNQVETPMMYASTYTRYHENDSYTMASLPYGNGAFYMLFILPNEGVALSDVVSKMDHASLAEAYDQGFSQEVNIKLPKFQSSYEIELNNILQDLGMETSFTDMADFSNMSDIPLFISLVKQKAFVDVNEKGTEAAAVTGIGMDVTSAGPSPQPKNFFLDRPFLYLIKEVSTGTIFFMGEVTQL